MARSPAYQHDPCVLSFIGTEVLGADAVEVAANNVAIAASSSFVADLAVITDGPDGINGQGSIASWEIPVNSGNFFRELRQFDENSTYINRWIAGAWLGWQIQETSSEPGTAAAITSVPNVPGASSFTIDGVPVAGAVANDGFVVGTGSDIHNEGFEVHAQYQADGFVRLLVENKNATPTTFNAQGVTIYKVSGSAPVGVPLAGTAAGEEIVFNGATDVRTRPIYPIPVRGSIGVAITVLTYRMPWPFEIVDAEGSVGGNSFDYTVNIDGTPVTGLTGISVNTSAIAQAGGATGDNIGVEGQHVNVVLSNSAAASDWYVAPLVRRAGA